MQQPSYVDPISGATYDLASPRWRSDTGAPLLVSTQQGMTRSDIDSSVPSLWRYRAALPVPEASAISLGEGKTPLIETEWNTARVRFKLEWFSPSGSFKDRGASVMLSILRHQGVAAVLEDSSGNGGAAVATYAAAGGMTATIFAPTSTSPAKIAQTRALGARIELVPGPREAAQQAAIGASDSAFYASHNWQPFFIEGVKTLAYELWEDLGFRAPEHVVLPVGAGSTLLGCFIGFGELIRSGEIKRMPRLWAAQPLACSPLDAAINDVVREVTPTVAEGASIRHPVRLPQLIDAVRLSNGGAVTVTEAQIGAALAQLTARGFFAEPTSAVAAAGYSSLMTDGRIRPGEEAVVVLTGSGLKAANRVAELTLSERR